MPKTAGDGHAKRDELPSTSQRSGRKAQETFAQTHDSALTEYHDEQRANRVAYAALKHTHEKVGDRWEPKAASGPSDEQARGGVNTSERTAGGVNSTSTKKHLQEVARRLNIRGRSSMGKAGLVEAVQRANDRATAASRNSS